MAQNINIKIADVPIRISVSLYKWYDFLSKKFSSFIHQYSNSFFQFDIINKSSHRNRYNYSVDKKWQKVKIYCPDSLRFFKKFSDYFKIAFSELFLQNNGFLLHSSSLAKKGVGYLFIGKHGSGKSTIIKLAKYKQDYKPFNDDYAIIRKINDEFLLFSSPFLEKNKIAIKNDSAKVTKIFFIKKAKFTKIEKLDVQTTYQYLLGNLLTIQVIKGLKRKYSQKYLNSLMTLVYSFAKSVDAYRLYFTKSTDFIKFLK